MLLNQEHTILHGCMVLKRVYVIPNVTDPCAFTSDLARPDPDNSKQSS